MSDGAFRVLHRLLDRAAANLETWCAAADGAALPHGHIRTVVALTRLTVEDLAASDAGERVHAAVRAAAPCSRRMRRPVQARPVERSD